MALIQCPDCGKQVSDQAPSCPQCGRPIAKTGENQPATGTKCPKCGKLITPIVTNVGGGSCSVGSRERWTCPACKKVIFRKGCFVATAVYGDEDFVEVQFLRAFRDTILSCSSAGRVFIWLYYHVGPYAALVVEKVPMFRRVARLVLDAAVATIERGSGLRRSCFRESR
jgi:hypothetical protein